MEQIYIVSNQFSYYNMNCQRQTKISQQNNVEICRKRTPNGCVCIDKNAYYDYTWGCVKNLKGGLSYYGKKKKNDGW